VDTAVAEVDTDFAQSEKYSTFVSYLFSLLAVA